MDLRVISGLRGKPAVAPRDDVFPAD
jgi:hypothetical protein